MTIGISLREVANSWAAAIKADTALATFCTTNFGKVPIIRVGLNEKAPLAEADAPFIQIIPMESAQGDTESEFSWSLDIDLGVVDTTFSDYLADGIVREKAFYLADEYNDLVRDAVSGITGTNLVMDAWSYFSRYEFFPLVVLQVSASTRLSNTLGPTPIGL